MEVTETFQHPHRVPASVYSSHRVIALRFSRGGLHQQDADVLGGLRTLVPDVTAPCSSQVSPNPDSRWISDTTRPSVTTSPPRYLPPYRDQCTFHRRREQFSPALVLAQKAFTAFALPGLGRLMASLTLSRPAGRAGPTPAARGKAARPASTPCGRVA